MYYNTVFPSDTLVAIAFSSALSYFTGLNISKMYFSHWKAPGESERMWSVNLDASISGEYQTRGGHSCRPSE